MKKIILAVVMLAAVLTGCQTAEKAEDNGWAVKINDKTVSREEFNIYLYETQKSFESLGGEDIWETDFDGRSAETVAKENTLSTLTFVKLTAERAENMEVETTEEDKQAAKAGAEEMYNSLTDTVRESIGADEQLYYDVMLENILREGKDIRPYMEKAIYQKPEKHCFENKTEITEKRGMSGIGG